jgi:hypothetical protein
MYYGWGPRKQPAFHDKAFERAKLPPWDARWHTLSPVARKYLLDKIKVPANRYRDITPPQVKAEVFPQSVREELIAAGFITAPETHPGNRKPQVHLVKDAIDFCTRLRVLRRYHLLDADQPSELEKYVNYCFATYDLQGEINRVLQSAGIQPHLLFGSVYEVYVSRQRWPGWVAAHLGDSLAEQILAIVEKAGGKLPLAELPRRLAGHDPAAVRAALEKLITRLALFEDLDPQTLELQVGLLPAVQADMERARQPRVRPALQPCAPPADPGPEGGIYVPDLRAILLELASGRARLKRDRDLFQKDFDRLAAVLEPLPDWLLEHYDLKTLQRIDDALRWAHSLELVRDHKTGDNSWLELTPQGQKWLGRRVEDQYAAFYDLLRKPRKPDPYSWGYQGDADFLGAQVTATRAGQRPHQSSYLQHAPKPEQLQPLRQAVHAAFRDLPVGAYYRLDNFLDHTCFGSHNPILLGLQPTEIEVHLGGRLVAPLEEQYEPVGRHLLEQAVLNRLIPFGCLQAGQDEDGSLLIARRPRLDLYFGEEPAEVPAAEIEATKVVVQPDFSIIVIGLEPAPLAELAPFCERVKGRPAQGAVTLRITRESVIKAVAGGLTGTEILARLQRHASTPVPDNVAHEVRDWAAWIRRVSAGPVVLLRCPDLLTADRVKSTLGRQAERLNETMVAYPGIELSTAERQKLLERGVILGGGEAEALGIGH